MNERRKPAIKLVEDFIEDIKELPEIDLIKAMSYVQGLMAKGPEPNRSRERM